MSVFKGKISITQTGIVNEKLNKHFISSVICGESCQSCGKYEDSYTMRIENENGDWRSEKTCICGFRKVDSSEREKIRIDDALKLFNSIILDAPNELTFNKPENDILKRGLCAWHDPQTEPPETSEQLWINREALIGVEIEHENFFNPYFNLLDYNGKNENNGQKNEENKAPDGPPKTL